MKKLSHRFTKGNNQKLYSIQGGENKFMKKGISALLAGTMALSMFTSLASAASTAMTTEQRYEILEDQNIFTGFPNGDAGLDQNMTRAQFARVAALLLDLDLNTPPAKATFKDVPKGHWAFEEVEAAVAAKIVSGVGNGLFNPSAPVKIQEMARVLVDALGIEIDTKAKVDGSVAAWAVPYVAAAVEAGLIPKMADYTASATRAQLVDASFEAYEVLSFSITAATVLTPTSVEVTFSDGTKHTVTLDKALVVNQATEVSFEHMGRTFTTTVTLAAAPLTVTKAISLTNTSIEVTLKDAVTAVTPASFTLKNATGAAVTVNSATLSANGKSVLLSTGALTPLQINTLTVGTNNFQVVGAPADTGAPTISTATAASNTSVTLTFSERMGATAANAANYTIAGLTVTAASVDGDKVTLTTSAQTPGTVYKVVINNATDISGNAIKANSEASFGGVAADTTKPGIESATASTNTKVKVIFDEKVTAATATAIANYAISGLTITAAALEDDGRTVILTTSSQTTGTVYKVVVTNVTDLSGNVINADDDEFSFGGLAADTSKPELTNATATSNTKVKLFFNDDLDKTTAGNIANYTIAGLTVTAASVEGMTVTLTTSAQTQGTIYKVAVVNVTDVSGNVINADKDEFSFGGLAADTTAPKVSSASAVSNTAVQVIFDSPIAEPMPYQFNFGTELGYAFNVKAVTLAPYQAGQVWEVWTGSQANRAYTLDVTGVVDESGNVLNEDADTATFGGFSTVASNAAPKVTSAASLYNNVVRVNFDQPLNKDFLEPNDFRITTSGTEAATKSIATASVNDVSKVNSVILSEDMKSVTLYFSDANETMTQGLVYTVTVPAGAVTTTAGVVNLDKDNTANFGGIETVNPAPTVTGATALNNQTLRVTFSEPIKVADPLNGAAFVVAPVATNPATQAFNGVFQAMRVAPDRMSVTLYYSGADSTNKLVAGALYTVTVNAGAVLDEAGLVSLPAGDDKVSSRRATFAGISSSVAAPRVSAVVAVNTNTLDVNFDQPVDATLVGGTVSITVNAGGAPVTANLVGTRAENAEGTKYRLFFTGAPFANGTVYKLTVTNAAVKNSNNYTLTNDTNNGTFAGISTANAAPALASAVASSATVIRVTFSEAVQVSTVQAADFKLSGDGTSVSAAVAVNADGQGNATTFDLTIAGTAAKTVYTLSVTGDITGEFGQDAINKTPTVTFVTFS